MTKLWTVSRGPILATETDIQKAEAINALLVRPISILPQKPGDHIHPFAIGLFDEIRTLLKPEVGATTLRRAIAAFVHTKRYYFAGAQPDSARHDIDGRPLELLTDEDRLTAQNRFLTLTQKIPGDVKSGLIPSTPSPTMPVMTKSDQIRANLLGRDKLRRPS